MSAHLVIMLAMSVVLVVSLAAPSTALGLSAPDQATPYPTVQPGPSIAGVVKLELADWPSGHVTDGSAYRLLSARETFAWPHGSARGGLESGIGRIAIPDLSKDATGDSRSTHIAIANLVPVPGFTDFTVVIFDQNGMLDYLCNRLDEGQVEYISLDQWGYVSPGFTGSALVSAQFWDHDVLQDGQLVRNVVGLAAVAADWSVMAGSRPAAGSVVPGVALDTSIGLPQLWHDNVLCGGLRPIRPPPTATPTPGPSPTPYPTATSTPTPSTAPPYAPQAPDQHLPALLALTDDAACALDIVIENIGQEPAKAVILTWGAPGDCGEACSGPVGVTCSGLLRPGGRWVSSLDDLHPDARSGAVFSFTTKSFNEISELPFALCDLVADVMCETLYFGVRGDCAEYARFKRAYEMGLSFAGIPMDLAWGSPLVVQVHRDCDSPDPTGLPISSTYTSVWGPALGHQASADDDLVYALPIVHAAGAGGQSVVHVQNAGHACADVTLWVAPDSNCGGADRCATFTLAPGEARTVDTIACTGTAETGSAWVQSSAPVAVAVDTAARNVLATYTGTPAQLRDMHGRPLLGASDAVAFAPLVYSNYLGWITQVRVQNTGIEDAVLRATFLDSAGDAVSVRQFGPLCPGGGLVIDTSAITGVPYDWLGSLRIESFPADAAPVASPWHGPEPSSTPHRTPGPPLAPPPTRTPGSPTAIVTPSTATPSASFQPTAAPTSTALTTPRSTIRLPIVLRTK